MRAVNVPLCSNERPSTSTATAPATRPRAANAPSPSALVCVPIAAGATPLALADGRFCDLAYAAQRALHEDARLESHARYALAVIDEWLAHAQRVAHAPLIGALFRVTAARRRLRACAHSPGHSARLGALCLV